MLISFSVTSIEIQEHVATKINPFKSIQILPQALLSVKLFYSSTKTDFFLTQKKAKAIKLFYVLDNKS